MTEQVYDQREDLHALRNVTTAAVRGSFAMPPAISNPSGIVPMDLRILVRPDTVEEKSKGGIIIPESAQEKEKYAQCKATVVAIGENAFEEAASRSPAFVKPQPGTRVLIAKYGGVLLKGNDGVEYRIMNDEDIIARLEE
jgi:chaperonin GroES